jgi:hypothetical protein
MIISYPSFLWIKYRMEEFDYNPDKLSRPIFTVISLPLTGPNYKISEISALNFKDHTIKCYTDNSGHLKIYFQNPPWPVFSLIKNRLEKAPLKELSTVLAELLMK